MTPPKQVHRSEIVACLALATDLGMGQPLEQGFGTARLAVEIGQAIGLGRRQLADAYYISLLRFVGCHAHAQADAKETGDEIAFRAGIAPILNARPAEQLRFVVTRTGQGSPASVRLGMVAGALAAGSKGPRETVAATCEVAQMIATRLGMGPGVVDGLAYTFERYDGTGLPDGAPGEAIPGPAHLAMVARDFELLYRLGGRELAEYEAGKRRGRAYAPVVADAFLEHGLELLDSSAASPGWDGLMALDPEPALLTPEQLSEAMSSFADFSDVKSPFTHGYSHRVRELVTAAWGQPGPELELLGAAALVQELGMASVPSAILAKAGPLTDGEWERVRLHPYFTERLLARSTGLASAGLLAGTHHERIDGSGYHRGTRGPELSAPARLLGAAGSYVAMTSDRPWRSALAPPDAASALAQLAKSGALAPPAVDAVLSAAGQPTTGRLQSIWPAGLTDREVEVLRLLCRGLSNRRVAERLVISVKTVGRHVENIYAKTGVSTRAGATMFALQHQLTQVPE